MRPGCLPDVCPHGCVLSYVVQRAPWADDLDYERSMGTLCGMISDDPAPLQPIALCWSRGTGAGVPAIGIAMGGADHRSARRTFARHAATAGVWVGPSGPHGSANLVVRSDQVPETGGPGPTPPAMDSGTDVRVAPGDQETTGGDAPEALDLTSGDASASRGDATMPQVPTVGAGSVPRFTERTCRLGWRIVPSCEI